MEGGHRSFKRVLVEGRNMMNFDVAQSISAVLAHLASLALTTFLSCEASDVHPCKSSKRNWAPSHRAALGIALDQRLNMLKG